MDIKFQEITIETLCDGFEDNDELGVVAYGGKLDIRPPYQREFIYKDPQRDAVIKSVRNGFPLNVMYWAVRDDGTFEVIDGQQRTLSICQYVNNDFSINNLFFHNLQDDQQQQIRDYGLMIYLCSGTNSEKLDWFKTINIAGEEHTPQEIRNAVYAGPWTADAKRHFSKTNCVASLLARKYMRGEPIRQHYLHQAIAWHSEGKIEDYMAKHQFDKNAKDLWNYFQKVIEWVKATFPTYRKEMRSVKWGLLYNQFHDKKLSTKKLEKEVARLMEDEEVGNKSGIYRYVLDGNEKHLNLRRFPPKMRREAYERQKGVCTKCNERFDFEQMEGDHVTPWHEGGKTTPENCYMLCKECNRRKSGK